MCIRDRSKWASRSYCSALMIIANKAFRKQTFTPGFSWSPFLDFYSENLLGILVPEILLKWRHQPRRVFLSFLILFSLFPSILWYITSRFLVIIQHDFLNTHLKKTSNSCLILLCYLPCFQVIYNVLNTTSQIFSFLCFDILAVSYTHLDVYKRQVKNVIYDLKAW